MMSLWRLTAILAVFFVAQDTSVISALPACMQQNYDSSAFRVSPGGYSPDIMTHDVCKQLCADLKFPLAGLFYGGFCLCSNHTADLEEADLDCDMFCSGNTDDVCGSNNTHLIYVLESDLMGTVESIQIDVDAEEFFTDAAVKISMTVESSTDVTVRVSFGDGTSQQFAGEPYEVEKFYRVPGEYTIHAIAVDIAEMNPAVFDELQVIVNDKAIEYELDCPRVVEPRAATSCNLTVFSGNDLLLEYQMRSEDEIVGLEISAPHYFYVGPPIPPSVSGDEASFPNEEEVFLPYSRVEFQSFLVGFELLVKETGTLYLQVLSSDCGADDYCEGDRRCGSSSCPPPGNRVCGDEALCSHIGQCVDPESPPICVARYGPDNKFLEKYSFEVTAGEVGYLYHPLSEWRNHPIAAGDIIGFKTDGGSAVGCRNATDGEKEAGMEDANPDRTLGVRHYIRAILTQAYNLSLEYMYNQTGNQSVYVGVSNTWSEEPKKGYGYIPVQIPLSGVTVELNKENSVLDKAIAATVFVVNGSDVTILWNYYGEAEEETFPGEALENGYPKDITCNKPGDYTLTVNASNLWASEVVSVDFHCFAPIGREWTLTSNSPKSIPPGDIDFDLEFGGSSLPSSAVYVVDFGDGEYLDTTDISSDSESWKSFTHKYGGDGEFSVVLNISNPVNFEIFELTVQVIEKMGNLTVQPFFLDSGSYPQDKKELKNVEKTDAPKGSTVYFENSISGQVSKYMLTADDGSLDKESDESVISHEFAEVGEWQLTFKAYSSQLDEYSNEVTLLLRILDPILDVDFSVSSTSINAEEGVEFTIAVTSVDDFTCVVFKSADGSPFLAFGNRDICLLYYAEGSFKHIERKTSRRKRDVTEAEWVDDNTIRILYEYAYGGEFMAVADVFNSVSRVTKTATISVSDGDYVNPLVWIDENSTNVNNPIKRQRAYDFRIETTAIFRDNASYLASHLWNAFKVDASGNELEEIDLTELKTHNCSALRVLKRYLDIGLYKFVYTLTVYDETEEEQKVEDEEEEEDMYEDFYSKMLKNETEEEEDFTISYENRTVLGKRSVYTFLEIIPTPLIPMLLNGGASYVLRGFHQSVTLEPTVYTEDPDYPEEKDFEVEWFCLRRDKDEELKELEEFKYDTSNPSSPIKDRSSVNEANNRGGCFGKGPGKMDIGNKDYALDCNSFLQFDAIYEIVAVIRKGTKVTEGRLRVEVIEKNPPSLRIRCEKKVACFPQVQGQYINPNSFIPLRTDCLDDCGEEGSLTLEWTVYSSGLKTFDKNLIDGWDDHTKVDMDRMGINKTMFIENPDVRVYLVEVAASSPDPQVPRGLSSMLLIINNPPENGDCRINSVTGMALLNLFTIEFSNWDDQDGHIIADYSIYVKYGQESLRLSYGLKTKVEVVLPYGDLQVWCSISDNIGGTTLYSAANFTTLLPTEEELEQYEERRFFDRCLAEGKMSLASQIVIAKNSIVMEYKRRRNQSGDFDGVSDAAVNAKWEEYMDQDGIDSSYFTMQAKDEIWEMLTEQLEKQMNTDAKLKNKEVGKLLRLPMEALPDAEIFGGALSAVSDNGPSDLAVKQQLMRGMDNMFDVINGTEVPHPEDLKIVIGQFGSLADSIAGSLADSNIGGNFLPFELKRAEEELNYDATEPNYFLYYVDGNRQEVRDRLENRAIDAAKEDQSANAKEMVGKMKEMVASIQQDCMEDIMVGTEPFYTESKGGFQMTFLKNYASNLTGSVISQGSSSIRLPDMCKVLKTEDCGNDDAAIGVQSVRWTQPLESYGEGASNLSENSNVIQIEITPRDGSSSIPVTDSEEPFVICIPQSNSGSSSPTLEKVVPRFSRDDDILIYHTIFVETTGVAVVVTLTVDKPKAPLILLYKYGEQPYLQEYDAIMRLEDIEQENGMYKLIIGSDIISEPQKNLSLAIGHLSNKTDAEKFFGDPKKYNLTVVNMTNKFSTNYSISIAVSGCYYFDEGLEKWSTEGCKVLESSASATCCECNHLTSFGSGFFVTPNEIDFNYVFANAGFQNNITIYVTLIVIFSVFVLLLIFARWKDRKDLEKLGATPLPDNEVGDKYIYEILIFSGHQRNAGTKSNVFFIVSGEEDETEVRHLADDKRPILQQGSVDVFIMSVPRSLGQLNYLRIWHDNSGSGKWSSWYCQYIVFRDVQTGLKYEFLVNRWFAVEKDDGLIDRLIPVAGREQVTEFSHLFSTNSRRNLADRHLWFSVFMRPPRSRFTRVQRVCCCMAVLCLSMLANAMYYQRTSAKPTSGGFKLGPLSLSPEQIAVGIISNFLVFPPTFVMIFFFRKSRPRQLRPSRIEIALKKQRAEWKKKKPEKPDSSVIKHPRNDEEAQLFHRKKRFSLPWWCVFFGWLFVIASIGSSMFFLWAYGIEFGDEKTSKWLTSLVISFFSSVLITQPIKIILMAIVVSCLCRSIDYDEDDADEDEEDPHLKPDEEFLHNSKRSKKASYRPMDLEALEEARKEREKEVKMYNVIREISAYFFFLWVIMILSYGNRDPNNFYFREAIINGFIKPGDLWVEFNNVNTERKFWNWTYNALVPELFALPWYNGRDPLGLRLYLDDRNNLKIGYGVLRQVRIQPRSCKVHWLMETITPECAGFGSVVFEDGTLYTKGWRKVTSNETLVPPEYKYLTAAQLKGYPFWGQMDWYGGGGYVVPLVARRDSDVKYLLRRLERLERDGWIDKYTRAVFVEFGVYNAQVNLFCAVTILAEFLPGGGVVPYYHIDPLRLLNYHTGFGFFQMIIEIIFVVFTIFFTVKELTALCREGTSYFRSYWNIAELVSLVTSYTGIANHVYKMFVTAEILRIFNETEGTGYVKLQEAVLLNDLFCYQIGLIMSISTLKFLKLLRFNKRIGVLSSTLRICARELKSFSVCLMVVFIAFVILFWLLLGRFIREFSTFVYSIESSISMMLKKFNYEDMYAAQPIFTPIAFFAFSLATAVILINILLTIIIRSFEEVKHDVTLQGNEYEIMDFFLARMKALLGCGAAKVRPLPSMYRDKKVTKDTVSSFPDKVDRLVDFINEFYFENQMDFNSQDFLKKMNLGKATEREKKKTKPVKAKKSRIPKNVSDRFDDF